MARSFRCLGLVALLQVLATGALADCKQNALESLKSSAPDGYAVYQRIPDKKFFKNLVSCGDTQAGLPTAVHESVHYITEDADAFPLVSGGDLHRPHEVSAFYPPYKIAGEFKHDDFVDMYLRKGRATAAVNFLYLMDELNAYTHDLNAAMDLKALRKADVYADSRDGLAALMAFVALYVNDAREKDAATWDGLKEEKVSKALSTLWGRAEKTMEASCGLANFGMEDRMYIARVCKPEVQASLGAVLGAEPGCASECLKGDTKPEDRELSAEAGSGEDASAEKYVETAPASRTLWSHRAKRRVSKVSDLSPPASTD